MQFAALLVPDLELGFYFEVGVAVSIDDSEVTGLVDLFLMSRIPPKTLFQHTRVLDRYVQEDEMSKLDRVNGHNSAMTKIAFPLLIGILVVDPVLYVVREQVLQFDRCMKLQA